MTSDPPPDAASNELDEVSEPRAAGRLVASLLQMPELERFRRRRLGADSTVDLTLLGRARDLVRAVAVALTRNAPEDWQRLQAAWAALRVPPRATATDAEDPVAEPDGAEAAHDTLPQMPALRPPFPTDPGPLPPPLVAAPAFASASPCEIGSDQARPPPWGETRTAQGIGSPAADGPGAMRDPDTEPPGPPPAAVVLPFVETLPRASSPGLVRHDWRPQSYADLAEQTASLAGDGSWPACADDAVTFAGRNASSMSVEEYAALCVRCEKRPEQVDAAHAVFGVHGEQAREQLHRRWRLWLDSDPVLHRRWRALCAEFRLARS